MAVNFSREAQAKQAGYQRIAGVDEVGRGPLAGPVVAAAVVLPEDFPLEGLDDSKKLSASKREELFPIIKKLALACEVGIVEATQIDEINILQATFSAMREAINKIKPGTDHKPAVDYILVDGPMTIPGLDISQKAIPQGDRESASIAAASIIAKVTRDRLMEQYHALYPQYHFNLHKGYGTKDHLEAIFSNGLCPLHRRSFNLTKQLGLFNFAVKA